VRGSGKRGRSGSVGKLREILAANRRGKGLGIYSICSANRFVLESAMLQAAQDHSLLLIESTSNQVNQFGGYTGQTPAEFVKFVSDLAKEMRFPEARIILGGDHLGPHVWRKEAAGTAMAKARDMVAAFVQAGFSKIHLDASMPCADDNLKPGEALEEQVVSARAAELCQAAEAAHREIRAAGAAPVYVIGTEVPIPGGEELGSRAPEVTRASAVKHTLEVAKHEFQSRGLADAWERVIAVVVQPGVEFGDSSIFPYDAKKAKPLSTFLGRGWGGVYEAHATDYQSGAALRRMVLDYFGILKVGPWLTFAFREAVFALAAVERELLSGKAGVTLSCLPEVLETAMVENPVHWKSYYHGEENALRIARKYSYSDRARYYWAQPAVAAAVQKLLGNLTTYSAPVSLLSQYLPRQADAVRAGALANEPARLIRHKILEVLGLYSYACGYRTEKRGGTAGQHAE
jgi:D-tagatose-1,6-bisphosphate aldolase subunit GatZ/KbaZ